MGGKRTAEQNRAAQLRHIYRLEIADYERMLAEQGGGCAICGGLNPSGRHLSVDHDQSCCEGSRRTCGRCVRGLLCQTCNLALGLLRDNVENLARAINYLTKRDL